ncbi:nitrate- and nitrite sensing domain-containing protein [Krasilnikovia sp. MM14-A1004]|uniref:sensor histidine kinase n=1 Tax=Krasilnikovia sp. MM14-A1004 TaxID=3373541 RepID=UPI00399CC992
MSTGSSLQPATHSGPGAGPGARGSRRSGGFLRLRDARIRSKLALILFVPLLAVLGLATVRLVDVGGRAYAANQVEELTRLATDVSELTQALHAERMAAAEYLADPAAKPGAYNAAVAHTDDRIDRYRANRLALGDLPAAVSDRLNRIDDHLRTMDATRKKVTDRDEIAVSEAVLRYGVVITDLVGYGEALSQFAGDGAVADSLRALSAFSRAKAGTAEQEAVAYASRVSGDVSAEQLSSFIATQTSQQEALLAFSLVASPAQRSLVNSTVTGDAVNLADQVSTRLARSDAVPPTDITQAFGAVVDLMRWAEQRLESEIVTQAHDASASVTRQTAVEIAIVVLVLGIAIALAVVLARSLNLSLRRLREGALAVANRDLPDAVARLRDERNLSEVGVEEVVRQVRDPIQLTNRDEVGQVAQAFNVVHREAVRIAAEQAALRTSVSAMFLNLARRSQALVDRMIGELDLIERGEEDPKRLAQLFELDHLATRMRRNDENLLVLAGADSSPPRREDALLVDALRAAQSEVELYNRIEFGTVDTDISVTALAVNDVVRLIAELLDNATRFSPPNTVVVADGRRIRDYVVVQVEDRGLGMSEEQMDLLNRRLAEPPTVDVAAFRLMGLAVVGRLAARYGIKVELRANLEGGTVAQVTLPSSIVVLPNRSIDQPTRGGRQLDGNSAGWPDAIAAGRTGAATAILPAIAPEPWQPYDDAGEPLRADTGALPVLPPPAALPGPQPFVPAQRPPLPRREVDLPTGEHPALPPLPRRAQDPWQTGEQPTRPPLPTRVAQPIEAPSATNAATDAYAAIGSPTAALPTLPQPDSPLAVGFLSPDGHRVAPPSRPVSPHPNGWGAALAAMPPSPPPPTPAPAQERAEAPIFLQMQASWFRTHDGTSPEEWGMPTAGYAPPPAPPMPKPESTTAAQTNAAPPSTASSAPAAANGLGRTASPGGGSPVAPNGITGAASPASGPASPATGPAFPAPGPDSPALGPDAAVAGAASGSSSEGQGVGARDRFARAVADSPRSDPDLDLHENHHSGHNDRPTSVPPAGENGELPGVPRPRPSAEDAWRTAADDGWQRALAASAPPDNGTTRSGLPKRVPQAQLVPGGVQSNPRNQQRRSPDEVRGLLSAYHRGVQRGRTAGSAETAAAAPASKEKQL